MKIVSILILYIFLISQVFSTATPDIENFGSKPIESNELINARNKSIKFMNLNVECQLMILDSLRMSKLLALSEINNRSFFLLIEKVFQRKLAQKTVIISDPYMMRGQFFVGFQIMESDDVIEFKQLSAISKMIRYFGHLIRKLYIKITFRLPEKQAQALYELINMYCSDSLKELYISNIYNDIFAKVSKPFRNVEIVSFDGSFKHFGNSRMQFTQLFHSTKFLDFGSSNIDILDLYGGTLNNLEQLSADNSDFLSTSTLKSIIMSHQNIRSLTIKCIKLELLQIIANEASNLEELVLSHYDDVHIGNVTLHFEFLRSFTVWGYIDTMPSMFTFGENIKEIEVDAVTKNTTKVVEMILKHKTSLQNLRILVTLNDFEVSLLAKAEWPMLVEMKLSCDKDVQLDTIIKLIENAKYLQKIQLYFEAKNIGQSVMDAVKERFPFQWLFEENDYSLSLLSI